LAAIGLDVDGVLRNTAIHAYFASCKVISGNGGTAPALDAFVRDLNLDFLTYYQACGAKLATIDELLEKFRACVKVHDDEQPFPDVAEFLVTLRHLGVKVFAVSSHPQEKLHGWFKAHGLDDHFVHFSGGSRDKAVCIAKACEELRVNPSAVAYVGDWGLDMRGAAGAGVLPIGITRGYEVRQGLYESGAAHVVDHLLEVSEAIR
jgi:phosphoglycolate phosphatase-like HAD superfamily hydrolase